MGIYNRDYFREANPKGAGDWGLDWLPVVKFLILTNIVVFLLQIFVVREKRWSALEMLRKQNPEIDKILAQKEADPETWETLKKDYPELDTILAEKNLGNLWFPTQKISLVQEWFELDPNKVIHDGQIWRLLTHAFCHDRYGIWHIVLNMLLLYWFGNTLESMYGSREFLLFYLTAAVVAGLAFIGLDLYTGSSIPGIGASGAVLGVLMLYTVHFPREIIHLCWVLPVEMRWLMALYLIWDLHPVLLALAGDPVVTGIAHAAHLGGLAFGFCYGKYQWRLESLVDRISWPRWRWQRRSRLRIAPATLPEPALSWEQDRVDQILKKISAAGQQNLTPEELLFLQEMSQKMKPRTKR